MYICVAIDKSQLSNVLQWVSPNATQEATKNGSSVDPSTRCSPVLALTRGLFLAGTPPFSCGCLPAESAALTLSLALNPLPLLVVSCFLVF